MSTATSDNISNSSSNSSSNNSNSNAALLQTLKAEKAKAVEVEDYLLAAKLKDQIEALDDGSTQRGIRLFLHDAVPLHSGDWRFPPMQEVPCALKGVPQLTKIIKPPDADTLWQWYEECKNLDADPSWAELWPSASSLAVALQERREMVQGRRVMELGAGLGLVGVVAACVGASNVTLMDREPYALHCAMSTAHLAEVEDRVQAAVVDWSTREFEERYAGSADCVVASDVLYDPNTVESLARMIAMLLLPTGRENGGSADSSDTTDNSKNSSDNTRKLWLTDPKAERVAGLQKKFVAALESEGASVTVTELTPTTVHAACYSEECKGETVLIEATWKC